LPEWSVVAGLRDLTSALVDQAFQAQVDAGEEEQLFPESLVVGLAGIGLDRWRRRARRTQLVSRDRR
jgi:hypothetical protein